MLTPLLAVTEQPTGFHPSFAFLEHQRTAISSRSIAQSILIFTWSTVASWVRVSVGKQGVVEPLTFTIHFPRLHPRD